jgi:glycosyltransferase involved in cell wall biosynthesis
MNYLISPILYNGSCFNDIVLEILNSAKRNNVKFKLMPISYGKLSSFGLENPGDYIKNSIEKLIFLKDKLRNGDKLLLVDFFFPGLDLLEFYLKRKNISVFKLGLMHGGSFVDGDLYGEYKWLANFEKGWFDIFNVVVCPSKFFVSNLDFKYRKKIKILPWGLNNHLKPEFADKKIDVIFPHRFAHDKGVKDLLLVAKKMKNVNFVVTGLGKKVIDDLPVDLKKIYFELHRLPNVKILKMEDTEQHIETLKSAKIIFSAARQEGFGYSVFKSIRCGAIPVLPNRCCYPEFFNKKYLYSSIEDAIRLINNFLVNYPKDYFYLSNDLFNFNKIVKYFK